jgi:hypothetical protein|tara:strand:- start:3099 stop:3428 length:330 start_codon:yes stop_codon:yes gene_type:complete
MIETIGGFKLARFVAFTNGTETVDGSTGKNNRMERGGSVVANPIWEPAAPNSPKQRFDSPKYASQTGGYGEINVRDTPLNQHGTMGKVEPAKPQPDLAGHNAAPHTKRP